MRRLRWVADGGASEAEPRALDGAERLVVVRGEAELLGVGPRLDVFPRLCEIKILWRVRAKSCVFALYGAFVISFLGVLK